MLKFAIILSIIEPVFYFILITTLSFKRPQYSIERNYISELSSISSPHRLLISLFSFVLLGVTMLFHAWALDQLTLDSTFTPIANISLYAAGLAMIALGIVRADGETPTNIGRWHRPLTGPAAAGLPIAMLAYSSIFWNDERWSIFWPALSIFLAALILIVDEVLLKKLSYIVGAVQRLGIGFALLWMFGTSLWMYTLI